MIWGRACERIRKERSNTSILAFKEHAIGDRQMSGSKGRVRNRTDGDMGHLSVVQDEGECIVKPLHVVLISTPLPMTMVFLRGGMNIRYSRSATYEEEKATG